MLSETLQIEEQLSDAVDLCRRWAVPVSPTYSKHWDNAKAVDFLLREGVPKDAAILDLGCRSGVLLTWLDTLGFKKLYGCDARLPLPPIKSWVLMGEWRAATLGVKCLLRHWPRLKRARIEAVPFPSDSFDICTSMSVIEHGADLPQFFSEVHRVLKPGGYLIVSTDYWPRRIELGIENQPWPSLGASLVFDRDGLEKIVALAADKGFELVEPGEFDARDRLTGYHGPEFTFVFLAFRKCS